MEMYKIRVTIMSMLVETLMARVRGRPLRSLSWALRGMAGANSDKIIWIGHYLLKSATIIK